MFSDMPREFSNELKGNFCAMKCVSKMSDRKRKKVIEKVKGMNKEEIKEYVSILANKGVKL